MSGDSGSGMPTTEWTMVSEAGSPDDPRARASLEELCRRYWPPVYAYARRKTKDSDAALDLTQAFFEHLLQPNVLAKADRNVGRFRTFLLTALRNFAHNEWVKRNAQKRGGGIDFVPFDTSHAESLCAGVSDADPEAAFEAQWQRRSIELATQRVEARMKRQDRQERFEVLAHLLTEEPDEGEYARLGERLGLTKNAVALTVHRIRRMLVQELRRLLVEEGGELGEG